MATPKNMTNDQLFRALVNSQSAMKAELLAEISKHRAETQKGFKEVNKKMDNGFKEVNNRVDKLGHELFVLNEDAPTNEDFNKLVKRVDKLEKYQNFTTA